jgi:phosphoadenosine phosphosulfate reductase
MERTSHATPIQDLVTDSEDVIRGALEQFAPGKIAISFSGAEDVVLIDLVKNMDLDCDVFCLDTGRLHIETYEFLERVRDHYAIEFELLMPDADAVRDLVRSKGLFSFYRDGHNECCSVRKIQPLRAKLATLDAWITGQRRDQSVTRADVPHEQDDAAFSSNEHALVKFNPLADWSSADVWRYIRENQVPYNALHDSGYVSIGCQPCTRPVSPHEHERAGRWWWEEATQKECGLHGQNVVKIISQ